MPTKRTWSPSSACTAAKSGSSFLHGPHVEPHTLMTIGCPISDAPARRRCRASARRRRAAARPSTSALVPIEGFRDRVAGVELDGVVVVGVLPLCGDRPADASDASAATTSEPTSSRGRTFTTPGYVWRWRYVCSTPSPPPPPPGGKAVVAARACGAEPAGRRSVAAGRQTPSRRPTPRGPARPVCRGEASEVRRNRHLVDDHGGPRVLGRTTTRSLVGDDPAVLDQLATPHAPRLGSLEGALDGRSSASCALAADGLGAGGVERDVREEQVGERAVAVGATRAGDAYGDGLDELVESGVRARSWLSSVAYMSDVPLGRGEERKNQKGRRDLAIPTASEGASTCVTSELPEASGRALGSGWR